MDSISLAKSIVFRFRRVLLRKTQLFTFTIRASRSMDSTNNEKMLKNTGLYSLRRNIEKIVTRVEEIAPNALEFEEERKIKQEEIIKRQNLWENLNYSDASLTALADVSKIVDFLKDLQYQAEEVNLISELADKDIINYQLIQQAYEESVKSSKFLDYYEMSQFLRGPYDKQGACVTIKAASQNPSSQVWAERILSMYIKWAEKHGFKMRIVQKIAPENCRVESGTIIENITSENCRAEVDSATIIEKIASKYCRAESGTIIENIASANCRAESGTIVEEIAWENCRAQTGTITEKTALENCRVESGTIIEKIALENCRVESSTTVEKIVPENCGVESTTIEFESEYMYGYLFGEKGTHVMVNESDQECLAEVDVIPLFLDKDFDMEIDENEIEFIIPTLENGNSHNNGVIIHHLPTGITLQSSGERSNFANKIKARNRLKAKLLVLAEELGVCDINKITRASVQNELKHVTRCYMFRPQKLVRDLKTGVQMLGLNSVLEGNIEPFIRRNINLRLRGETY